MREWFALATPTALAAGGLVRVNGMRIDAASLVRAGDVVTVALDRVRVLKVAGFSERRGVASDAAHLFGNLQPEIVPAPAAAAKPLAAGGRPGPARAARNPAPEASRTMNNSIPAMVLAQPDPLG